MSKKWHLIYSIPVAEHITDIGIGYYVDITSGDNTNTRYFRPTFYEAIKARDLLLDPNYEGKINKYNMQWLKSHKLSELLPYSFRLTGVICNTLEEIYTEVMVWLELGEMTNIMAERRAVVFGHMTEGNDLTVASFAGFLKMSISGHSKEGLPVAGPVNTYEDVTEDSEIVSVAENVITKKVHIFESRVGSEVFSLDDLNEALDQFNFKRSRTHGNTCDDEQRGQREASS